MQKDNIQKYIFQVTKLSFLKFKRNKHTNKITKTYLCFTTRKINNECNEYDPHFDLIILYDFFTK